jgi:hypothetical protein
MIARIGVRKIVQNPIATVINTALMTKFTKDPM